MSLFKKTVKTLVPRATRSVTGVSVPSMRHLKLELVRSMSKLSHTVIRDLKMEMLDQNCETTNQAYRLFDVDGDGSLTAEEISNILISVGETSSDLGFFFEGENTETITDYSFVVNWIAFLIRHVNKKNPATAEAELTAEWAKYSTDGTTVISADSVYEWIEDHYPEFSEDEIEALVDGADINGDGDVNYAAYTKLVCQTILKLDSEALKATFDSIDANSDGQISQDELQAATGRISLENKLANIDLDHSGTLSFVEFLYSIFKTKGQDHLTQTFAEYDTNGSGQINRDELAAWFTKHGGTTDMAQIDLLIQGADFNGDGKINYDEFIYMIANRQL